MILIHTLKFIMLEVMNVSFQLLVNKFIWFFLEKLKNPLKFLSYKILQLYPARFLHLANQQGWSTFSHFSHFWQNLIMIISKSWKTISKINLKKDSIFDSVFHRFWTISATQNWTKIIQKALMSISRKSLFYHC